MQDADLSVQIKKRRRSGTTLRIFYLCNRIRRQVSDMVIYGTMYYYIKL